MRRGYDARMEISPRELREAEIPDAFRGFNREVVDEFLDRAAATIEALQERNRQLTERLQAALAAAESAQQEVEAAQAELEAARAGAPAAPAPAPPVVVPEPEPRPEPVVAAAPPPPPPPLVPAPAPMPMATASAAGFSDDLIQRTLLMAQRAADETVAEADNYALRTREEANRDAAKTIADANSEAQRISAESRAEIDRTMRELETRRVDLESGIDLLERFDTDYRARLRAAIESDLAAIERRPVLSPGTRPAIAPLTVDALEAGDQEALADVSEDPGPPVGGDDEPTATLDVDDRSDDEIEELAVLEVESELVAGVLVDAEDDLDFDEAPVGEPVAPVWGRDEPAPPLVPAPPVDAEPVSGDMLDDDEFFASLREAVHDDAPLGPFDQPNPGLFPKE